MATILPFIVSPRPVASGRTGEAAIIIFPGVRYEAVDGTDGERGKTGGRGKRASGQNSCKNS